MNVYVYSDESGVFDYRHNQYFVFGGLICFGDKEKEKTIRKYRHVENVLRMNNSRNKNHELKASFLTNKEKGKIYRSLNQNYKFVVLVKQRDLLRDTFSDKRHKQRYLDYAYKMVLKKCFKTLIENNVINPQQVKRMYFQVDEHSTATDGLYELKENLLNEFKLGTFNYYYNVYFHPIFPALEGLDVKFCNSASTTLVRAADIIANRAYKEAILNKGSVSNMKNTFVFYLPLNRIVQKGLDYFHKK